MPKAMYYNLISMFYLLIWFIIMPCHESAALAKIKKKAQTTFNPSYKIAQDPVRQSASVGPQRSEKYGKEKT